MEILQYIDVAIPLWQVGLYVIFITLFTLFGRARLALITSYLFTMFWVFILNKDKFGTTQQQTLFFMSLFIISGFILTIFAVWSFYQEPDNS